MKIIVDMHHFGTREFPKGGIDGQLNGVIVDIRIELGLWEFELTHPQEVGETGHCKVCARYTEEKITFRTGAEIFSLSQIGDGAGYWPAGYWPNGPWHLLLVALAVEGYMVEEFGSKPFLNFIMNLSRLG